MATEADARFPRYLVETPHNGFVLMTAKDAAWVYRQRWRAVARLRPDGRVPHEADHPRRKMAYPRPSRRHLWFEMSHSRVTLLWLLL